MVVLCVLRVMRVLRGHGAFHVMPGRTASMHCTPIAPRTVPAGARRTRAAPGAARTAVRAAPDAVCCTGQTLTPKSCAMPRRPDAYPWPMARNFHSAPLRYSSPKTIAVSVEASSVRS